MEPIQQFADAQSLTAELSTNLSPRQEPGQFTAGWNQTDAEYPRDLCVHNLFELQARRMPDQVAVCFEGRELTYGELNARANQVAHYLIKLGIVSEGFVGISIERSIEMLVALLGILKAGGTYVPLDPAFPKDRLAFMLEDSRLKFLLTQKKLMGELPAHGGTTVFIEEEWNRIAQESMQDPPPNTRPENLAYILYTSGSTGKPKGVQVEHRSVVNFLTSMQREPGLTADDVLVAVTTLSFDIAGLELYLPLMVGARIVMVSRSVACDGEQLLATIKQSGATVMQATPVTWRLLIDAGWQNSELKVICGGEGLPRDLARQLVKRSPSVWNLYGPTETTIWSSLYRVEDEGNALVPIGRPIANTQMYILDSKLEPVPMGEMGELYIGGDGLARGYLNRPELTAEKFIAHPFAAGKRLYRTGDLARYLGSGDIEFVGRIDQQVKIRGYRIELGEIEAVLEEQAGVRQAVVVAREGGGGEKRLVAYYVAEPGQEVSGRELRRALKEKLAEYMIPAGFVKLGALPLTANGKVDRKALPEPEWEQVEGGEGSSYVEAEDELQRQLIKIWEGVLGRERIGIRDNFFELGGHSLLAVRVMNRVEQACGKRVPVATLFQAPTVEQLAGLLRREGWAPSWSSLVTIQGSGTKPPFFCVHGIGGGVLGYRDLARRLGPDQPVYGLQAQGLDGKRPCHRRVEEMAAYYIEEIRRVQPEGPYYLGGLSFGGVVAFEMARQLRTQNQEVALVVLLDTFAARHQSKWSLFIKLLSLPVAQKITYLAQKSGEMSGFARDLFLPRALKDVRQANSEAAKYYVAKSYDGRVVLFRATDKSLRGLEDPVAAWNEVVPAGLQVCEISGSHTGIMAEPQVTELAGKLTSHLAEAAEVLGARARVTA